MKPLVEQNTMAALLYYKFRNNAVHGIEVRMVEEYFFTEDEPFWEGMSNDYYPPILMVRFPARFLHNVLLRCISTLKHSLVEKGKLPPDIHYHVFGSGFDHIELIDENLLPHGQRMALRRR